MPGGSGAWRCGSAPWGRRPPPRPSGSSRRRTGRGIPSAGAAGARCGVLASRLVEVVRGDTAPTTRPRPPCVDVRGGGRKWTGPGVQRMKCALPREVPAASVPEAAKLLASLATKTEKLAQLISGRARLRRDHRGAPRTSGPRPSEHRGLTPARALRTAYVRPRWSQSLAPMVMAGAERFWEGGR